MVVELDVTDLMDTPAGRDEFGTPSSEIERCEKHDVLHRHDGQCLDCKREKDGGA